MRELRSSGVAVLVLTLLSATSCGRVTISSTRLGSEAESLVTQAKRGNKRTPLSTPSSSLNARGFRGSFRVTLITGEVTAMPPFVAQYGFEIDNPSSAKAVYLVASSRFEGTREDLVRDPSEGAVTEGDPYHPGTVLNYKRLRSGGGIGLLGHAHRNQRGPR